MTAEAIVALVVAHRLHRAFGFGLRRVGCPIRVHDRNLFRSRLFTDDGAMLVGVSHDPEWTPRRIAATSSRKAIIRLRPCVLASSNACRRAVTIEKPTATHIATTRMPNAIRMFPMIAHNGDLWLR